ncbi:hypothetical protein V8F20_000498 [Naviculisporaceae sp. PSN 640]
MCFAEEDPDSPNDTISSSQPTPFESDTAQSASTYILSTDKAPDFLIGRLLSDQPLRYSPSKTRVDRLWWYLPKTFSGVMSCHFVAACGDDGSPVMVRTSEFSDKSRVPEMISRRYGARQGGWIFHPKNARVWKVPTSRFRALCFFPMLMFGCLGTFQSPTVYPVRGTFITSVQHPAWKSCIEISFCCYFFLACTVLYQCPVIPVPFCNSSFGGPKCPPPCVCLVPAPGLVHYTKGIDRPHLLPTLDSGPVPALANNTKRCSAVQYQYRTTPSTMPQNAHGRRPSVAPIIRPPSS